MYYVCIFFCTRQLWPCISHSLTTIQYVMYFRYGAVNNHKFPTCYWDASLFDCRHIQRRQFAHWGEICYLGRRLTCFTNGSCWLLFSSFAFLLSA